MINEAEGVATVKPKKSEAFLGAANLRFDCAVHSSALPRLCVINTHYIASQRCFQRFLFYYY